MMEYNEKIIKEIFWSREIQAFSGRNYKQCFKAERFLYNSANRRREISLLSISGFEIQGIDIGNFSTYFLDEGSG